MVRVKKFVIEPGDYWYADEQTGEPRVLNATPALVEHWHRSGKAMLAAGLSVPVPFEHQKAATPQTPQERAAARLRDNAGWVADYTLENGALYSLCDIEDDEVAKKLPKTVRWTSPYFSSFTDGNGRRWDGVISHLALTTRPRIVKQQPFPSVAAALSVATHPAAPWAPSSLPPGGGVALSRDGLLARADDGAPRPAYPVAFSLYAGVALAGEERPDPKPKGGPPAAKKGDAPPAKDDKPTSTPPDGLDPVAKSLVDPDGDMKAADVMCHLLEMMGVPVPEGDPESFLERGVMALFEHLKGKMGNDMADPNLTPPPNPDPTKKAPPGTPPAPVRQEQPPLYMGLSLEQVRDEAAKVTDPQQKALWGAALAMLEEGRRAQEADRKTLDGLKQQALGRAQAARDERIARLGRNLTPAARDKLTALAQGAALAVGDDATVADPLAPMLEVLEASARDLPPLLTTPAAQLAALQVLPHPTEYAGEALTTEQADAMADQLAAGMSGLAPKKAS